MTEPASAQVDDRAVPSPVEPHFLWLRIFLATAVVFAHFAAIGGNETEGRRLISSTIAVQAFFVISGWIVAASCERSQTLLGFWLRRFARLYPLYAIVICVQAMLGLAFGDPGAGGLRELVRYLGANLAFANFLQPSLLGLFEHAPVSAINPSLWTLKIEAMFYAIVPLLVWFRRARGLRGLIGLYVVTAALFYVVDLRSHELGRNLPGQLRYFVAGMLCWQLSAARVFFDRRMLAPLAALGLGLAISFEHSFELSFLHPIFVAAFIYGASHVLPEPRRMPDISYGIYILHAPLIQFGYWKGFLSFDDLSLVYALLATGLLATASWYGLESPAIQLAKGWSARVDRRSLARRQSAPALANAPTAAAE